MRRPGSCGVLGGMLGLRRSRTIGQRGNDGRIEPMLRSTLAFALAAILAAPASIAQADDFYRGKTIRLILPSDVGGGYDLYGRAFAPYLKKHIPGDPTVVVQNMPGGGGLLSVNWLYNVAPKDGLFVGLMQRGTPFYPYFGDKNAHFNPTEFNWLGSFAAEAATILRWPYARSRKSHEA